MEKNLRTGIRYGLACGLVLGLLLGVPAGVAVSGYRGAGGIRPTSPEVKVSARLTVNPAKTQADIRALQRHAKDLLLGIDSPEKAAEHRQRWDERHALQAARLDEFEKSATSPEDKQLIQAMRTELAAYDAGFTKALGRIQDRLSKTTRDARGTRA
jgi:hypothetical protein